MAKSPLNYPRYKPNPLRPAGTGAFFDFATAVASRDTRKLESCSLVRRWGKAVAPSEAEQEAQPLPVPIAF